MTKNLMPSGSASAGALVAGLGLAGALLAGCAQAAPDNPGESAAMSSSPSPYLPSLGPSGGPKPPAEPEVPPLAKDEVRVTGLVERVELEGGCTVLRVDGGQTYELMGGDPQVVQPGSRLTVHGRMRTDVATVCQLGPVLEIISAQPA